MRARLAREAPRACDAGSHKLCMTASTDAERRALIKAANRAQVPIRFEQIVTAMSEDVAAVARLPSDIEPTSLRVRLLPGPLSTQS